MAQPPSPGSVATPSDYILLTVIMKHDQTKNLAELNEVLAEQAFWAKFPPEGVEVESWYVAMGLERFPKWWNRERFHHFGKARAGDRGFNGHIPFG